MRLLGIWVRVFLIALAVGMVTVYGLHLHPQSRAFSNGGFILFLALLLASGFTWMAAIAKDK